MESLMTRLKQMIPTLTPRQRDLGLVAAGMGGIMTGAKVLPMLAFAKGIVGLEQQWRRAHPEFQGDWRTRLERAVVFYNQTHQNQVNRVLHIIGNPLIAGGVMGMVAWPRYTPPWWLSQMSYGAGWTLNFVGHGVFERGAPAFADDPLAFVAGPIWDVMQFRRKNAQPIA